eukprot:7677377-Karenia_brevis.AAC.1
METDWWANCLGHGDQVQDWEGPIIIHTDGSGGEHSNDPKLRRCGWAWMINKANSYHARAPVAYFGWETNCAQS